MAARVLIILSPPRHPIGYLPITASVVGIQFTFPELDTIDRGMIARQKSTERIRIEGELSIQKRLHRRYNLM
jgi:hypothetical protein